MNPRIPLFIVPSKFSKAFAESFRGTGSKLCFFFPGLEYDLKLLKSSVSEAEYIIISLLNALVWALIVLLFIAVLTQLQAKEITPATFLPAIATFILFLIIFVRYPRILVRKAVESVDKDLVYALKDLLVQVNSGISLFNAMKNVGESNSYGSVSREFKEAVQDISGGESQERALEKTAGRTESEFLRRALWQIITVLKTGASVQGALENIVRSLTLHQNTRIKTYTQELNFWILIFVFVAIVIPSLGVTFLVILSSFTSTGVSEWTLMWLIGICLLGDYLIIEFVRIRRPAIHG